MTFQEKMAFVAAMQIAIDKRPDLFSIKDGDFYFLTNYRLPASLVLDLADDLFDLEEHIDEAANIERMRAAELEDAA